MRAFAGLILIGLVLSPAGADPEITPDPLRAPSALTPELPDDGAKAKRALKRDYSRVPVGLRIVLPPPSEEEKQKRSAARSTGPVVIGFHRDVPGAFEGDLSPRLEWDELPGGSLVSALSVRSPGAQSMRLGLRAALPPGGELRFFGEASGARFEVYTPEDFLPEGEATRWSPTVEGDTIGIEIALPSGKTRPALRLAIEAIAHAFLPTGLLPLAAKSGCPYVHIDVACRGDSIHDRNESATALIRFERGRYSSACSGTLLNDKDGDPNTRYFLTAEHCVNEASVARTVEAFWFYQKASCDGDDTRDARHTSTGGGTDLMREMYGRDVSLLRFREPLPGGLVLSGWDANSLAYPAEVYGIHHTGAKVKGYYAGSAVGRATARHGPPFMARLPLATAIVVEGSEGAVGGGASGSGLFLGNGGHLVGVLSGGPGCGELAGYGPFQDAFVALRYWLDPGGSLVRDDHGDHPDWATSVEVPSSTSGYLGGPTTSSYGPDLDDRDYFRFVLPARGELRVYTTNGTDLTIPSQPFYGVDTVGILTRPGSDFHRRDDNSGYARNFLLRVADAAPGTYHLEIRAFSGRQHGPYTLHAELSRPRPPPPPLPPPPPPPPPRPTVPSFGGADTARFSIAADHADGAAVGTVSATDADGDALTYSLGGIDRAWFSIDDTGLIAVAPGTALAGLGKDRFSVTAQVSDGEDERGLPEARPAIDDTLAVTITAFGVQGAVHRVPLLPPASHPYRQGFVRVINRSAQAGEVSIVAFDDAGVEHGPLTLRIEANAAVQFNSADLEAGSPGKGLASGTGAGEGAWRLELESALDIEALAYVRTPGGALASVHDVAPEDEAGHRVVFFNPASNRSQVSRLRLINPGEEAAAVRISGIDSAGEAGESAVTLTLAPRASRSLSAQALESGQGEGLVGALGDGAGKWRLRVTADRPIRVMSLLASGPHLTNVSTTPVDGPRSSDREVLK